MMVLRAPTSSTAAGVRGPTFGRYRPTRVAEQGGERLEVVTRSGARLTGKTATVSDVEITLAGHRIPKADVSQVYYLRVKPLSDNWEHAFRESLTLYPLSLLFQIHKIAVLLYDSSLPEDNTPLKLEWRTPLPHPPH